MATPILEPFVRQRAVVLVTYKRDGTPVSTPVSIAVEGETRLRPNLGDSLEVQADSQQPRGRGRPVHGARQAHGAGDPGPRHGARR